ncbi:hypothetical protein ES703_52945 [subsurface metagenome]
MQGIRGSAGQNCGLKVLHYGDLALGLSTRDGNSFCANELSSIMGSQSPGEKTIAISIMNYVSGGSSSTAQCSSHNFCPNLDIFSSVAIDYRFSGGTGRDVKFNYFL